MDAKLSDIRPFEVCSIRPPTENCSLTFRLTRNCYWNKCGFCPVYKFGARFSKRGLEEVTEDIRRAKRIDDLMFDEGITGLFSRGADYNRLDGLIARIRQEQGIHDTEDEEASGAKTDLDPRLEWFLPWFREHPGLRDSFHHVFSWRTGGGRTCFLGDADSLILEPGFLAETIRTVRGNFPTIERFTVYGRTRSAARLRSPRELKDYGDAGLNRVHFGLESGADAVLKLMNKGETREEHIDGLLKARESGLSCSAYIMPGLGGRDLSEAHARGTAEVVTRAAPDFVRLRSLQIFPQTPLEDMARRGEFTEADEETVAREIRIMVEEIGCETEIMSDSASNLLEVNGRLPGDRAAMLEAIDEYLGLSAREKLLFSLQSRISSFVGQYGGLSRDIHLALAPYIEGNRIDPSDASDDDLKGIISLIRSKLMP
jgi:radical SAM superfamily enzyme YgiQ (UPF0313 family)